VFEKGDDLGGAVAGRVLVAMGVAWEMRASMLDRE
jgi:hypothetical protein